MADGVDVLDQLGGLTEVGVRTGRIDDRADLALTNDRPGVHGVAGVGGGRE